MPKAKRITDERVEDAIKFLLGLRPKAGLRQEEVAKKMAPSIRRAMRMGYSLKEIQAIISKELGINIQLSKLQKAVFEGETDTSPAQAPTLAEGQEVEKADTPLSEEETTATQQATETTATEETAESSGASTDTPQPVNEENPAQEHDTPTVGTTATEESNESGEETPTPEREPVLVPFRVDLTTKKDEKDEASNLGAKWDQKHFTWYLFPNTNLVPFEKWLHRPLAEYQADAANNTMNCASLYAKKG